jgi:hypothetical protein
MYTRMPFRMAVRVATLGLLAGGCGAGGVSGLFGFFSGSGSDSSGSGGSGALDVVTTVEDPGGQTGSGPSDTDVPVVMHPEPGSLILFGGGLAAMAIRQRRRANARRRTARLS